MNIESHSLLPAITEPEAALRGWLGVDSLPADALPPKSFDASLDSRVIVPTARTTLAANETFATRALVLSSSDCGSGATVAVYARPLGSADGFQAHAMTQAAAGRCVFELDQDAAAQPPFDDDFEWWIGANLTSPVAKVAAFPTHADAGAVWMTTVRAQF